MLRSLGRDATSVSRRVALFAKSIAGFSFWVLGTREASAHVKWFCAYDAAGQPRGLENVLCQDFELLLGLALFWLFCGCVVERTSLGEMMTRAIDSFAGHIQPHTETMVRAVCAF